MQRRITEEFREPTNRSTDLDLVRLTLVVQTTVFGEKIDEPNQVSKKWNGRNQAAAFHHDQNGDSQPKRQSHHDSECLIKLHDREPSGYFGAFKAI